MKVIHVLNHYLPDHIAGTEVYVSSLVRELKKSDIESKIIIPNYGKNVNESYIFEGISIIKYAEPTIATRNVIIGKIEPEGLKKFISILHNEQPDLVHFHELAGSIGIGLYHVQAVKKAGYKSLMTFHLVKYTCKTGTLIYMNQMKCDGKIRELECSKCWLNDIGGKGLRFLLIKNAYTLLHLLHIDFRFLRNSLGTALSLPQIIRDIKNNILKLEKNTNKFIILTEWYREILLSNGISVSHITVIEQGLPSIQSRNTTLIKPSKKLRLVYIGRITPFKGLDILLAALNGIPMDIVSLDIYGTITDDTYVKECISLSEGKSNIVWKGRIDHSLVIETLKDYDLLCIPSSISEMGPFVLKEAFAAGIPVLASKVYGNEEQIIDGENGWLFKFKDVGDLNNKLEMLINNPMLVINAKKNLPKIRSFEAVAKEHKKLYKEIIDFI